MRHSREEIVGFIEEATKGMGDLVGESGMFEGRECSSNAFLFGLLVALTQTTDLCPIWNLEIGKYPNLRKWMESWVVKYFPERKDSWK
jgi:hypothetical protein